MSAKELVCKEKVLLCRQRTASPPLAGLALAALPYHSAFRPEPASAVL